MPGVNDQIRKTQLRQEQKARQQDKQELLRLVSEGRLHEADERQLESLKLALELNQLFQQKQPTPSVTIDAAAVTEIVSGAVEQALKGLTSEKVSSSNFVNLARPEMRQVSLTDLRQSEDKIEIVDHGRTLADATAEVNDASDKLAKLKKLRDGQ